MHRLLLKGLTLVFLEALELLAEDFDFGLEFDLVVSQLHELVHHARALLLSLFAAFARTLSILELPVLLLGKYFSHFENLLLRNFFDVDYMSTYVDDVAVFLFQLTVIVIDVVVIAGQYPIFRFSFLGSFIFWLGDLRLWRHPIATSIDVIDRL